MAAAGGLDAGVLSAGLLARERLGSTGIGEGVAVPHCKVPGLAALQCALGRSGDGIDFRALDGKPTRIFVALFAPERAGAEHLQALARVSRLLKRPEFRKALLEAPDAARHVPAGRRRGRAAVRRSPPGRLAGSFRSAPRGAARRIAFVPSSRLPPGAGTPLSASLVLGAVVWAGGWRRGTPGPSIAGARRLLRRRCSEWRPRRLGRPGPKATRAPRLVVDCGWCPQAAVESSSSPARPRHRPRSGNRRRTITRESSPASRRPARTVARISPRGAPFASPSARAVPAGAGVPHSGASARGGGNRRCSGPV